jgi:hypothetical protein
MSGSLQLKLMPAHYCTALNLHFIELANLVRQAVLGNARAGVPEVNRPAWSQWLALAFTAVGRLIEAKHYNNTHVCMMQLLSTPACCKLHWKCYDTATTLSYSQPLKTHAPGSPFGCYTLEPSPVLPSTPLDQLLCFVQLYTPCPTLLLVPTAL